MSSRRWDRLKSAARARTPWVTPVPNSRLAVRMVARLARAGSRNRSEHSRSRVSKVAEPETCDAISRRRSSADSSPSSCMVTEPSAAIALPPPPSSRTKSSSKGASSRVSRFRRPVTADISPAATAPPTSRGSGIAEPYALEAVQVEEPPHPEVAGTHDGEHPQQEQLAGQSMKRVQVGRSEGREDQ